MASFTTRPVIQGRHGVVAAGHYLATEIALRVLDHGGNAIDAGVAAVFALTVLKPQSCGIAGECPILLWRAPATGAGDGARAGGGGVRPDLPNPLAISGQGTAPAAATIEWFRGQGLDMIPGDGLLPITVPATVGAAIEALRVGGRLGLAETLGPVVDLADDGFAIYPALEAQLIAHTPRYLAEWPANEEIFLVNGAPPPVGWRLRQHAWAASLRRLLDAEAAELRRGGDRDAGLDAGLRVFYRGSIAEQMVEFASSTPVRDATGRMHTGLLTETDLATYETRLETPVSVSYKGLDVYKCGPWTQGPVFLQQLRLLEGVDLPALGHNSTAYLHTLIEAAKLAFADRERWYGDPLFADVPMERLLSSEYAAERRGLIDPAHASAEFRPGDVAAAALAYRGGGPALTAGDTTHVDVVDAEGNLFSATPSGGWLESSPVIPGLGFPLGTRGQVFNLTPGHPNALAPGKRPRTTLTPSLVTRNGRPHLVFGTPGGDQQDQWTLQFFLNVVEFGMDLQEAIDAPLVHTEHFPSSFWPHETHPQRLVAEGRIPGAVIDDLRALGHDVHVTDDWASGQVCAVRFDPDTGLIEGAASPRGLAAYALGR